MKKQLFMALGMAVTAMTFSSGCLVISGNGGDGDCTESCYKYEVCEQYCDPWECWNECWDETTCDVTCTETTVEVEVETTSCACDIDCSEGNGCIDNRCAPLDRGDNGKSGLCQTCDDSHDCSGDNTRCVRLNFDDASRQDEKVCSTTCSSNTDCSAGFECVNVSNDDGVPAQCLPVARNAGARTCNSGSDLGCVVATDCGVGESCVNNECAAPTNAGCSSSNPCADGKVCTNFKCVDANTPECTTRTDCGTGEICVDGSCEAQAEACVFNSECDGGKCVDGQCVSSCTTNDQCGPGEMCRESLCEEVTCRRNADCSPGNMCVNANCVATCDAQNACDAGFVCTAQGFCDKDPSVQCRNNAECAAEEVCNDGTCATACSCNQDCAGGQVCDPGSNTCVSPSNPAPGQSCQDTCDCPSGQECNAGTCG